jgi:hypothetical protein
MSNNGQVSLKLLSNIMLGGGAVALALVAVVWVVLHIFVL